MSTDVALAKTPHAVVHDMSGSDCSMSVAGRPWRLPSGVDLEIVGTYLVHCDVFDATRTSTSGFGARAVDEVHLGDAVAGAAEQRQRAAIEQERQARLRARLARARLARRELLRALLDRQHQRHLRNQRQPVLERLRALDQLAVEPVLRNLRIAILDEQRAAAGRGEELPAIVARAVVVGIVDVDRRRRLPLHRRQEHVAMPPVDARHRVVEPVLVEESFRLARA